jgi:Glyoxalase/Bleomycin resistance protein/Dioxygenase superfamily
MNGPRRAFSWVIEVEDVEQTYRRAVEKALPIQQHLTTQPWGHRSSCVREPNGLPLYFFTETKRGESSPNCLELLNDARLGGKELSQGRMTGNMTTEWRW